MPRRCAATTTRGPRRRRRTSFTPSTWRSTACTTARNKITFTGSQNASNPALRENDEAYVKIDDDSVHDTYRTHFDRLWGVAYPGTSDNTNLCKGVKTLPQGGEVKTVKTT
ncbi:phospholipase D-like domain-containing protein [Streptomyces sp. NPDC051684]|uniref:phospholipase D-like domain-containing protein n=1 Tax=Streptomyces sp. NPDC051684 TaxID=3365670 RepID=UPI0037A2B215